MADEKKKPGLVLAIGVGKKPPMPGMDEENEADEEDTEGGDDFEFAADSLMDAIESKDKEAFRAALKTAVMACMSNDYDSEK